MPKGGNCVLSALAKGLSWATSGAKSPIDLSAGEVIRARIVEHYTASTTTTTRHSSMACGKGSKYTINVLGAALVLGPRGSLALSVL